MTIIWSPTLKFVATWSMTRGGNFQASFLPSFVFMATALSDLSIADIVPYALFCGRPVPGAADAAGDGGAAAGADWAAKGEHWAPRERASRTAHPAPAR